MAFVITMIKTGTKTKASVTKQQPNLQESQKKQHNNTRQENGRKSQQN